MRNITIAVLLFLDLTLCQTPAPCGTFEWVRHAQRKSFDSRPMLDTQGAICQLLEISGQDFLEQQRTGWTLAKFNAAGQVTLQHSLVSQAWDAGIISAESDGLLAWYHVGGSITVAGTTFPLPDPEVNNVVVKHDSSGAALWIAPIATGWYDARLGSVIADASGNFYATGFFFRDIADTLRKAHIQKVNTSGVVQWRQTFEGAEHADGRMACLDGLGNCYVVCGLGDTPEGSFFLVKLDSSGSVLWARAPVGAGGKNFPLHLRILTGGRVQLLGHFRNSIDLGEGPVAAATATERDVFIATYSADGILESARALGLAASAWFGVTSCAFSADDTLYLAGWFRDRLAIQGSVVQYEDATRPVISRSDMFVARFDPAGDLTGLIQGGGSGDKIATGLALDSTGHAYVTGSFKGTTRFGQIILSSFGQGSDADVFVTKVSFDSQQPPSLTIFQAGNQVTLSWTNSGSNLILEQSRTFGEDAAWSAVSATPIAEGDRLSVSVPLANNKGFFRLRQP